MFSAYTLGSRIKLENPILNYTSNSDTNMKMPTGTGTYDYRITIFEDDLPLFIIDFG